MIQEQFSFGKERLRRGKIFKVDHDIFADKNMLRCGRKRKMMRIFFNCENIEGGGPSPWVVGQPQFNQGELF